MAASMQFEPSQPPAAARARPAPAPAPASVRVERHFHDALKGIVRAFQTHLNRSELDRQFMAMSAVYGRNGGLARGVDVGRQLEETGRGNFVSLARLIIADRIFAFEWRESFWIPMFQFDAPGLDVNAASSRVLAEFDRSLDGWALGMWFSQRSQWLAQRPPLELLHVNLPRVLEAARIDKFIAKG